MISKREERYKMNQISKISLVAMKFIVIMSIFFGLIYIVSMTGLGQLVFPKQSQGSQVFIVNAVGEKQVVGSALLGQTFNEAKYMIGRPQVVSNFAAGSEELKQLIEARVKAWRSFDKQNTADIPADLVMGSASGADAYISLEAANYQVKRIAQERGISEKAVREIIKQATSEKIAGIFGEQRVHVLNVNLLLDGYAQ